MLRDLLRVAYEMKFIKANSLQYIIVQIDEVGKLRGGWAKRYKSLKSDNWIGGSDRAMRWWCSWLILWAKI